MFKFNTANKALASYQEGLTSADETIKNLLQIIDNGHPERTRTADLQSLFDLKEAFLRQAQLLGALLLEAKLAMRYEARK